MSHYTLDELLDLWKGEKLTAEQMIGQLLLALREQDQRMRELARRLPALSDPTLPTGPAKAPSKSS